MRVAYFFKAFLRFFKFYAFYFRFLRDWDLPGQELYSYTGESITNLKVYCILLFTKFARLLVNFRVFCSKIFLLKWRRSCAITMSEVRDLRAATTNFFIDSIHSANSGLTKGVHKFSSPRLPVSITSKFLI
jgi:hypothetical protein